MIHRRARVRWSPQRDSRRIDDDKKQTNCSKQSFSHFCVGVFLRGLTRKVLASVSFFGLSLHLGVHLSRGRIGSERSSEEKNVRLRSVNRVMGPSSGLLYAHTSPLILIHQLVLRQVSRQLFRKNHVSARASKDDQNSCPYVQSPVPLHFDLNTRTLIDKTRSFNTAPHV